jgi:DNA-binding CsgD family transcriptional regulator
MKRPQSITKLTAKHAILMAIMSFGCNSSSREKARMLGLHHHNVSSAIQRIKVMDASRNV